MKSKILAIFSLLVIIFIAFFNIEITVRIVNQSINLFLNFVFPYLFPFMLLIQLFLKLKGGSLLTYIFQYPMYFLAKFKPYQTLSFLICILSGYPSNSLYIESLFIDKKISAKEGLNFIYLASFPTMFFVLGSLNKILDNYIVCKLIILSIFLSGFLILKRDNSSLNFITKIELYSEIKSYNFSMFLSIIKDTISSSILAILNIFSTYIFYSILSNIIKYIFPYNLTLIICAFLEFSSGVFEIAKMDINMVLKYNLIVFILSFGGISILTQIETNLSFLKINYKDYFLSKLKHAFIACLIFNIFYIFFIIWSFLLPYL